MNKNCLKSLKISTNLFIIISMLFALTVSANGFAQDNGDNGEDDDDLPTSSGTLLPSATGAPPTIIDDEDSIGDADED